MRKALFLLFVLALFLAGPVSVGAQGVCQDYCTKINAEVQRARDADPPEEPDFSEIKAEGRTCICNPLQSARFTDIVKNVLTILFNFALVLTPIMVVIAGIMFVTAAGDPSRVSRAKQILIWTAVGFVVILVARGLVLVLRTIIGF